MLHHPLIAAGLVWWALLGFVVHLDTSALIVGLLPTLAVVVNYFLAKHQRNLIARESAEKIKEVHTIVNSQADNYRAEIATLKQEVSGLREQVALLTPPPSASPAPA